MVSLSFAARVPVLAALVSAPCLAVAQPQTPRGAGCSPAGARFAIGEVYTPALAERARQAARALVVRKIEPGGAYTMELSPDRLNIEVDRSGIVRDLKCG
jgi:hypothetical protein